MENTKPEQGYDKNAISRQLAVYGAEAMGKLIKTSVFIQGLRGVQKKIFMNKLIEEIILFLFINDFFLKFLQIGIETAKNLILAGPNSVVLYDDQIVQINDLGSNFYCETSHVGKVSRAQASFPQLAELNPYVKVSVHKGPITQELLSNFNVVVFTNFYNRQALI